MGIEWLHPMFTIDFDKCLNWVENEPHFLSFFGYFSLAVSQCTLLFS